MKKFTIYIILFCSSMLGFSQTLRAQVLVATKFNTGAVQGIADLYNFSLENTLGFPLSVILKVQINEQNYGMLTEANSSLMILQPGANHFSSEIIQQYIFSYSATNVAQYLRTTGMFAEGKYIVTYRIINQTDQNILGESSFDFQPQKQTDIPASTEIKKDTSKIKKFFNNFSFHGTSEVAAQFSTNQSPYSIMPANYVNWNFNPQITAFDIPLSGRLFLTSMELPGQQSMNSFSINFDVNQLRTILKNKLTELMKKEKHLAKVADLNFNSYADEFAKIKDIFSNPSVLNELKQLGQLDSLKGIVDKFKDVGGDIKEGVNDMKELYGDIKTSYNDLKSELDLKKDSLATIDNIQIPEVDTSGLDNLKKKSMGLYNHAKDSLMKVKDSLTSLKDSLFRMKDKLLTKVNSIQGKVDAYSNDPSSLLSEGMDSLKGKIKAMEWLESKREYYERLMEKKKKIEEFGKKLGIMDSSGNIKIDDKFKDVDASKLGDPDYLYGKLKNCKFMRKIDKIMYSVRKLSIGMGTPQYSDFTLNGLAVNGFNIEVEPFKVFGAFTYGNIVNPVYSNSMLHGAYKRNIVGGKLGYGRLEESHIHITMLSSTDDTTSINPRDSLYLYNILPKDNKIIGVDAKVNLFKNKLKISAEFSGSQTIKDISNFYGTNNIINVPGTSSSADWISNILTQNQNVDKAVVDYAVFAKIEGSLFKDKTILSGSFKRVGPNYYSFGLPFLIRDMMTFEVKVSQKLWKNRIRLSGFVRRNNDNLNEVKPSTTNFFTYGFDASMSIPKFPTFRASLMPIALQNDSSILNMTVLNANVSHTYRIGKTQNTTSLSFINQTSESNDSLMNFNISYATLLHNISFAKGPSVNVTGSYISSSSAVQAKNTFMVGAGTSMTLFKIWNNTIGGNLYLNENELKWGAYLQTSISFLKYFTLNVRMENNQFNTYIYVPTATDYTQFICRTSLFARW